MRIAVFGAGAVGSLMAARLGLAGNDVTVFARGAHADAIAERGHIVLKDIRGEHHARVRLARTAAEAGPVDAILVTTKGHQHVEAARAIAPLLTADQPVAFAVNGLPWWYGANVALPGVDPARDPARLTLDPDGEIGRLIGIPRTVGAVIHSPNTIEAPGVVANRTEQNALVLGAVEPAFEPRLAPLRQALRAAGIDSSEDRPIRTEIWKKLMYTMCMGPMASITGLRNGQIRSDRDLIAILEKVSAEGVTIARAHGQPIDFKIEIPATGAIVNHKQSMLQDVERGRRPEYEPIIGLPRAYAHAAGIPCPTIDAMASLLKGKLAAADLL